MNSAFSPRIEITDPKNLFGRDDLFQKLISLANSNYSVSITGLRRFGKTSLLKCIETSLRSDTKSKVYPLYFDFKEVGSIIKGTDNVYKYMTACLIARLYKDSHLKDELTIKKKLIKPTGDWEDIFESLDDVSAVRIQGLFEEAVAFFSEYLEKTILFIIDEYEWLFRFSFDAPVGFMKLRNFSSRPSSGVSPFNFWIAGATSWDYLCTITGSGELNVIDAPPIYIGPIEYEFFEKMWMHEISKLESYPDHIKSRVDFAYKSSGGIPFYGKKIGNHLLSTIDNPSYTLIKSYFEELYESLQNEEKEILLKLAKLGQNFKPNKHVSELTEKGLVKRNGNHYEIKITFLKDFINSSIALKSDSDDSIPESQKLTDAIASLIENINNTHNNKQKSYIFEPVVDDAALLKDLRTPCRSRELFADFASSLYKIVYERTKTKKGGVSTSKGRLPDTFKKKNQFIEIVDMLRHSLGGGHLMDTFSHRPHQISKSQMLQILVGNKNEPNEPDEFYRLQIATLTLFKLELERLNDLVRKI